MPGAAGRKTEFFNRLLRKHSRTGSHSTGYGKVGTAIVNRELTLHRIRAITIDLDDTLWDVQPVIFAAERKLGRWLKLHYPRIIERVPLDAARQLRLEVMIEFPERQHDFRFLRRTLLRRMARIGGYPEAIAEDAFAVFDAARNDVSFFPGTLTALRALKAKYPLVAVTNGNANLHTIGIAQLFSAIVTAVDVGVPKPARPIFAAAIEHAGCTPAETLHVGDHPAQDVAGARDAGMRTAWVNREARDWPADLPPADLQVHNIGELPALLAAAIDAQEAQ